MTGRAGGWTGLVVAAAALVVPWAGAAAAPDFRLRAAGHVYRCGDLTVDIGRDGSATLARAGEPEQRPARGARWSPHGVRLTFAPPVGTVALSEYGATTSLKGKGTSAVCIVVQ